MPETRAVSAVESEEQLVRLAQSAISQCNWVVGECAAQWTQRFARGRTDADFAALVGLSADQVYQRRRVWETFGDVYTNYPALKWSHFYAALNWDDAAECLQWAEEIQASVAEMKAWRRMQRGEDLTVPSDEEPFSHLPTEPVPVRQPSDPSRRADSLPSTEETAARRSASETVLAAPAVARESNSSDYAPFREGAGSPAPAERLDALPEPSRAEPLRTNTEQLIKRMTTALERCHAALTDEVLADLHALPEKTRRRFLTAVSKLHERVMSRE